MRGTTPPIEQAAKRLRKEMTEAEQQLWKELRAKRQDGFRFRRQHPIGRFVADFCCTDQMLCIEVDGGVHDEQQERDAERTAYLEARGYRVIRFRNEEVLSAIHLVLRRIQAEIHDPVELAPAAVLPRSGRTEAGPGLLADVPPPER